MASGTARVPRPGDLAPDFTLPSTAGTDVTLSDYRGASHVLLAFFPLAFTSVCTAELCAFSADFSAFEELDATVLGISVDSIPTLQAFRATHGIGIDLLSDFKRDVCRAYGTLLDDLFFSRRACFLVDRAGVVRWTHVERDLGERRENAELLERLRALDEDGPQRS